MINLITYGVMIIVGGLIIGNIFYDLKIVPKPARFDTQSDITRKKILPYASIVATVTSLCFFLLLNFLLQDEFTNFIEQVEQDIESDKNSRRVLLVISTILSGMFVARQYLKGIGRFSENEIARGTNIDRDSRGFITFYLSISFFALYFTNRLANDSPSELSGSTVVQIIPISFIIGVGTYFLMKVTVVSSFKKVWKIIIDYFYE
jgi:hypothetical protein